MGCKLLQLNDYLTLQSSKNVAGFNFIDNESDIQYSECHHRKDRPTGFSAYSANTDTSYSYDTLGRLATVTDSNRATTYNYTKVGSRSDVTLPNGAKTVYQYDNLNRLTNLTNVNNNNDILSSYTYSLAPNGRRTAVVELTSKTNAPAPSSSDFSTRNIDYTYDGLNRLTKEVSECADNAELQFTDEYTYDLVGNRTQKIHTANVNETIGYTFNNNDQLTLESNNVKGDTVYTYDANGSQIGKVGQDSSYIYSYNLQNRLATATITRTETELMGTSKLVDITSSYVYNQSGIRVGANTSTTIDGGTVELKDTVYLTDPANFTGYSQVIEKSVNGTLTKSYTLGDDVLAQTSTINNQPSTIHFLYDGHGSTRLLTSATSAIANRFDYDAYGKSVGFVSNVTNPSATDMLYSGEQFDPNLQMQYLRARYYDQSNGRFNRLDPFNGNMGDPQSLHKYAYCHGDGVNGIDPTGKFSLIEAIAVIGVITALVSLHFYATNIIDGILTTVSNVYINPKVIIPRAWVSTAQNIYLKCYSALIGAKKIWKGFFGFNLTWSRLQIEVSDKWSTSGSMFGKGEIQYDINSRYIEQFKPVVLFISDIDETSFMDPAGLTASSRLGAAIEFFNSNNDVTVAHELGHVFGLLHTWDPKNLMYPTAVKNPEISLAQLGKAKRKIIEMNWNKP